jgi:hypothetical protein
MDNVYRITIPLRLFRAATVRESPWLGLESLPITPDNAGPRTARGTLLLAGGRCPAAPVRRRETRKRLEGPERALWEVAKLIFRKPFMGSDPAKSLGTA